MNFEIVEKFFTLSGEAPIAGKPVYLIRFAGCNLDCLYCDTTYRNEVNMLMNEQELGEEIKKAAQEYPGVSILLTGGEPLLGDRQSELLQVITQYPEIEFYIETNGSIYIEETHCTHSHIHYVLDWKTATSGHPGSFIQDNLKRMRGGIDCIKIVTGREDLGEIVKIIQQIRQENAELAIYLSPQWGNIELDELAEFIVRNRLPVSLSLQLHKIIWGDKRGV